MDFDALTHDQQLGILQETAEEMRSRGPGAVVVTIPGCGHAPALNVPDQIALVRRFLNGKS